jgi:hypothetical protein
LEWEVWAVFVVVVVELIITSFHDSMKINMWEFLQRLFSFFLSVYIFYEKKTEYLLE